MTKNLYLVIATDGLRVDLLKGTLSSLKDCIIPEACSGLIIVQNGPAESISTAVDVSFPMSVTYHHLKEANKSAALNFVLKNVESGLLYFLDDDVSVSNGAVMAMWEAFRMHPENAFFGGPADIRFEERPPDWMMRYLPTSVSGWRLPVRQISIHDQPHFLGFNWAATVEDLRRIGGFSITRGPGQKSVGQETFAQEGLLALGLTAYYVPDALVTHYAPKHHCTQEFALIRTHRYFVYRGLCPDRGLLATMILILTTVKSLVRAAFGCIQAMVLSDKQRMFRHKYVLWQMTGLLKGMFLKTFMGYLSFCLCWNILVKE